MGNHNAFNDVKKALDFIKENKPNVAWLDIEMPGMSGLRVICMAVPVLSLIWQVHITNFFYLVNVIHSSFRLIIRSSPSIVYSYVFVPSVVTIS